VYIARTSGGYVSALGLEPYALVQGLASKIMPSAVTTSPDTIPVEGSGHLDVARTHALWNTYGAPAAIVRRGDWVDRPSVMIAALYMGTGFLLMDVVARRGDLKEAEKIRKVGLDVGEATRTLDLFLPRTQVAPAADSGDVGRRQAVPVVP
jgi:hypothetical protein